MLHDRIYWESEVQGQTHGSPVPRLIVLAVLAVLFWGIAFWGW